MNTRISITSMNVKQLKELCNEEEFIEMFFEKIGQEWDNPQDKDGEEWDECSQQDFINIMKVVA